MLQLNGSMEGKVKVKSLSRVQFLAIPWTVAHQAPPPMGFSRRECWSGVPLLASQLASPCLQGAEKRLALRMELRLILKRCVIEESTE